MLDCSAVFLSETPQNWGGQGEGLRTCGGYITLTTSLANSADFTEGSLPIYWDVKCKASGTLSVVPMHLPSLVPRLLSPIDFSYCKRIRDGRLGMRAIVMSTSIECVLSPPPPPPPPRKKSERPWQRRWVAFDGSELKYFKNQGDKVCVNFSLF